MKKPKRHETNGEESFLAIDEYNLEREWINQPQLYHRYAEKLAKARLRLDEASASLEVITAEEDKAIRMDPETYGIDKVTEGSVKSTVLLQENYQDAVEAVNKCKYDVAIMQAAVTALDHRKKALEKLVELFLADYFSSPKVKGGDREAMEEMTKSTIRKRARLSR